MAKKKKESLSRTLAEVSKGVTKTVANDKSVSAKVRKQAKSDYRKASRISNSSASKNYISNSRLRRAGGSGSTSATSASMANRMRGESASQRNAGGNTIREIARSNTPKKNSVSRTYSELQNKTKDMNLTDTAVGRGMARAGLTAKGTAKEAYGGIKTTFSAIRDPNEERNIKADQLRKQRGEQTKGNKYEGAYDKLRNAQRDNREQREKDLKSASKMLESASADKEKAKKGLGKAGKFALDVESALLGMAGDAAVGAVTGTGQVGALGSMAVRSFGGAYNSAKKEGASDSQAALYAAVTGGKEVLTEKMFNVGKAFSGVFGKGLGDDVINKAAEKGAEKLAKKFGSEGAKNVILHGSNYLASALTEGLEEVASTASDPFVANAIYARAVGNPHSFDAGDTFYDFLVGAALGGLGGGIAEASNYSQGGQVKNVLGKDGLKEVADRVAYADEDSGISDSAKAISQMILNGEDVANAQALKLYKAAEAQEQKNFTQYRDAIKGATSIIERDNLISPSGLTVDESGQVIPSIGDNTNIKFQESRTEARKEAEKLQLKDDVAASIGDTIASIKTGIGVVDDIETIVRYPEAKAVYESVTGETLPSGRKALMEYLYKKNAENRVQSAREETEFWKDQAVGLLSQTETEDFGGNGQAVFTKATENLDVNELGNSALTKVRTTINDYYNSAKLGIPFSTLNDIAKPEYDAVSEDIKREAYNAGILDSNDIYKYLDGIAVNKDEPIKSSANKENRNANPGKLYVDADNAARKYFTNSQQKMWKALAEEFGIGIHIMDAESFSNAMESKGQETPENAEELPNGFYDNGEIYLNVETPDRATRYVFMHEFTHFLEQTAPKEYSELRKRMIDALIEDGSLERRLSRKRMQYGEGISQDDLIDEILADSTYEFLNDKDFANGIARESGNLAQAIINAIRNLIRKIRNVLARDEYTPSQNANMYAQLGILKDMEALWLDAVNAARGNAGVTEPTRENGDMQFSMKESVEETEELIAIHNLSFDKLNKTLELGGLPMPSIAITKARQGHTKFGEVSLVFGKDTIDPEGSSANTVYSGDAYTPTFPSIDYELNEKKAEALYARANKVGAVPMFNPVILSPLNIKDELKKWGGEAGLLERFKNDYGIKNFYLAETSTPVSVVKSEKAIELDADEAKRFDSILKLIPDEIGQLGNMTGREWNKLYGEQFKDAQKEAYRELNQSYTDEALSSLVDNVPAFRQIQIAQKIKRYAENGATEVERFDDYEATNAEIDKRLDESKYNEWLKELFKGIVKSKGIRNNKDTFTPNGNRRNFGILHYEYNLENIVKAMKEEESQGKNTFGGGNIRGAAAEKLGSVDEIKQKSSVLQNMTEEEYNASKREFDERFHELTYSLAKEPTGFTDAAALLVEAIVRNKTKSGIASYIKREGKGWTNYSDYIVNELLDLVNEIRSMPREYFEAKPRRVVDFNEIYTAVIPNNTPDDIRNKLNEYGINSLEYESGNNIDRIEKLNSIEGVRFSKKESTDASLSEMENVETVPTDEEVYEYMASHPEIYKEMWSFDEADKNYIKHKQNTYAELETKVEQLKQNQKKTYGKVLDEKSVRPAMNELVKSILQASEQGRGVKKTDNKMVNDCVANAKKIFTAYKNGDTELMITTSLNAAESMVESLKFIDDSMYVYYKDLRDYLRNTPIRVSDTIKGDIADYSAWRKSKFGKIRISDVGIPVDDVYTELCEKFPEMFDRELSNPTDQLLRMGEAIEEIQPYVVYLSSEEYDNLIRQTAGDLIDITVKGRAYKSMADRYEDRISAVKQRAEEARKDAQKKKKEAIGKEREKADVRVAEEKDKREQAVSKERERADARVTKEREKRKKADNRRKEAYKRRKSMKMLTEDYKWLSGRILKPTDDKHVPDRMVAPLAELLQYIDLETEYSKKFEKRTGKPTGVAVNLRNLKSALEDVSKSSEANWILEDEDLPQMIEELQKRIEGAAIYELDNSELDAVQALLHAIRVDVSNANKAFVASRSIDDTAKAVIWEANEYAANSKKRRSGGIVNQLLNESMVKPMEFFEHLGPTMKSVYMGLRRGMDVQSNRMKETRAFFAEVFEGYGKKGKPGSEVQKWRNEKTLQEFELESGEKISLNTAQIMSLYCLSKRVQAVGHIYGQGICASEIRDFGAIRSTIGDKDAHKKSTTMVERKDIMNIISKLTDEQIKMADKLQDYLNTTVAGWGNETSLLMYDRKKFTEENYFPIKTQDVYLDANFEKRQRNIESIKNFGFTKGTVVNANNPIVIDDIFAVVAKHVNQMILYNAYAPAISDFTRVYNYREVEGNQVESVQAILADTYGGKIIGQYISKFMSDLQSNTQTRRGGYEMVANILLANYKKAAIGASPRVALQQPTAIVRALSEIDAKYFVKMEHSPQLLQMATKKDNALKEMLEHCPIAYWKSMGFNQVDMARDIEDIMMNMEWSRLDVLTMSIYGALDTYTWSKIWKAIKAEQKDLHPEVEYESDEFWELCNERAIEVFDKTQVVDSVFHRSDVMRSDNLLIKSITSFMSEPTTTFNMLRSNLMRANDLRVQGKGKEAFKLTRRTLNVYIANAFACAMAAAIADAILKKQTGDDDDEENKSFIEFWLANTIVNFKNNVSPLNLMPITRDFSSFADGWGTKNMFEEGIALVIEDAVAIKDKATDPSSTKKTWEELITELAKDSSYLTGIPVKNFMRYGAGILDFLGINAFAAEKDSEGGQSKSLFGEILEMAGFSNGDDSANSQSQSLEAQYEESWLTKKLHEAGITEGTRLDNVLNFFGLNKSIEEQKEEHYQDMLSAAKAAGKGYVGVERDEKIYSKATDGYTKLAEAGEFEELARIRRVLVELDVDTTNFDERVESHIKTGIKKQIGEKGDSKLRNRLLNQLKEVYGYTDEQISTDVLAKTDTATAFQKALCEDNYDEAVKQLRYLRQAGLTYETFIDLYEKRWKVIDAKTTGTFSWPAQGRISSGFGQRWGTLHAGIDIAMPTGTEVVASDGGEVVYTGYNSAMGNYVDIKHSNGYVTRYQHLSSYGVLKGEKVKKGQYIASSGNTGNSTGPHLHFAVYRSTSHSGCSHSTAVDPSIFLKSN